MAIYIKFPNIEGNVNTEKHKGWVKLGFANFGVKRNVGMKIGNVNDRQKSTAEFSEMTIYKQLDSASNGLFDEFIRNKGIKTAELHVCPTDEEPIAKYVLHNVLVTSQDNFIGNDSIPTEEITLNYTKIELAHIERDEKNKPKSPEITGYDLEKAQPL